MNRPDTYPQPSPPIRRGVDSMEAHACRGSSLIVVRQRIDHIPAYSSGIIK